MGGHAYAKCVEIKGMHLLVDIEDPYEVRENGGWTTLVLEPEGRALRTIRFRPLDIFGIVGGERLENGMTIQFQTFFEEAVGSGGPTVRLEGTLMTKPEHAPLNFEVSCASQGEDPDPEWCLPILGQLRTKAEGCSIDEE